MGGELQWVAKQVWRLVTENPRRTIHSMKVGLALAITSSTVLEEKFYGVLGDNAIWSVMSVVVVFELTAGATIYKGANRAFGTLLAGILALGVECLADVAGPIGEPYIIALSILFMGTISTYTRFCEPFKSSFDYGVMIFLLTFSLILVSSYRVASYSHLAVSRFLNIALGGAIALITNMLIKPIWASEDLHKIITTNFYNLARALEVTFFKEDGDHYEECMEIDPRCDAYKDLLSSKHHEESLANYATWEPRWRGNKALWSQYVKVGGMLRSCTYMVPSLHGCVISNLQDSHTLQNPSLVECENVAMEVVSLLRKMGQTFQRKERSEKKEDLLRDLVNKVENLKQILNKNGQFLFVKCKSMAHVPTMENNVGDEGDNVENGQMSFDKEEVVHKTLALAVVAYFLIELVPQVSLLVDHVKILEEIANFKVSKDSIERKTFKLPMML